MISTLRLLLITLFMLSFNSHASDLAKEKRWADQVVDGIIDGDAVWLNDGKNEFLGIYTEAAEDKGRGVIIMHGTGIHPDWQQVVQPLRVGLTDYNWNTLSIQMPILPNEAEYIEYAPLYVEVTPRIKAAIKYLKDNGSSNIVLIGHSQGATMAAYALATSDIDVSGFVAIGMGSYADDPRMIPVNSIEKIKLPVLDLYGNEDLKEVLETTQARAAAAKKAGNMQYKQVEITGNHFFDDQEDSLVETVANWLK